MTAGPRAARAFTSDRAGPVFGHLLLALIDLAAGVLALLWPAPTVLVLVLVLGIWALVAGFTEIFSAFGRWETAGTRAMLILAGLLWVPSGVLLLAWPGPGAVTLALLFGIFAIVYGISQIVLGVRVRHIGRAVRSVPPDAPPESGRAGGRSPLPS